MNREPLKLDYKKLHLHDLIYTIDQYEIDALLVVGFFIDEYVKYAVLSDNFMAVRGDEDTVEIIVDDDSLFWLGDDKIYFADKEYMFQTARWLGFDERQIDEGKEHIKNTIEKIN